MTPDLKQLVYAFWDTMNKKKWEELANFFDPAAVVRWPNTLEKFGVADYIKVNKDYPSVWTLEVEDVQMTERNIASVVHIKSTKTASSLRAVSFFRFDQGKIQSLKEYFADDIAIPAWRVALLQDKTKN